MENGRENATQLSRMNCYIARSAFSNKRRRAFVIIIKEAEQKPVQLLPDLEVTVRIVLSYYKSVKETRRKK